ncbi:MAG: NAD-dependent epimerase/dehydratase family protein [Candidatus Dormibacteraeota bacterium]|nr:NAD-dependent epimerase/dehydratase family protein [Candidatus Dormibacteraeota bacterium]MBV8446153.1 NAD-dependent epimerase/dehydratase family protein [Candidatus Dormibacteraeota bacterium]
MRALVTGGAGFIGSHIVDALLERGDEVVVVDDLSRGRREQVDERAAFVEADVASSDMDAVFGAARPDVVFHQAAQIDVRESVRSPERDARTNVVGTVAVLGAAVASGCRRVIFASSGGAMYGDTDRIPTPEDHGAEPESPYGAAKACGELYGRTFSRMHGIDVVALRYANVYGPRQDPHGEAGVVAIFIERLLRGESAVINGDGLQTRDYVFVDDVVTANLLAADVIGSGAFNVGTAVETDVNTLFRHICAAADVDSQPQHGPAKPGEQRRSCLDIALAEHVLGWRPAVSLGEGLRRTVDWFRRV